MVAFISTLMASNFALAANTNTMPMGAEVCKAELDVLKIIADEQCRMVPDSLSNGYGSVLSLLHYGCRDASDAVISKGLECRKIITSS